MKTLPIISLLLLASLVSACSSNKPKSSAPPASEVVAPSSAAEQTQAGSAPAASDQSSAPAASAVGQTPAGAAPAASGQSAAVATDSAPPSYDPWEKWNRKVHRFNNGVDRYVAKPVATAYVKVVPHPVRKGVTNFFHNLSQPLTVVNSLLQGKPSEAWTALGRFLINTTVGIGGLFDPASHDKVPDRDEDFGQTLAVWGWHNSRYFELPFFGPRTVRDTFGLVGDMPLSPLQTIHNDWTRYSLQGLRLVDIRSRLMSLDSMRASMPDDYAFIRDGWLQRRNYQITDGGTRGKTQDSGLPEYLQDDDNNTTVPMDAIPTFSGVR